MEAELYSPDSSENFKKRKNPEIDPICSCTFLYVFGTNNVKHTKNVQRVRSQDFPWGCPNLVLDPTLQSRIDNDNAVFRSCISLSRLCISLSIPSFMNFTTILHIIQLPWLSLKSMSVVILGIPNLCQIVIPSMDISKENVQQTRCKRNMPCPTIGTF